MTNRTNNPMRWTAAEHVAVYLPFVLLAIAILPSLCCRFSAVTFDFPESVSRDRSTFESDSKEPASRPAATQPATQSMTERVIDEDAVIDAVIDDLLREEPHK
ncbi:MAG: hypothetical protein H6819_06785 [Phycisphaerales bacterium]|nr:hypothetical protein [Phycisphaerales bacterium]MCB9855287.1 hypothetical protein [Phycisphaerales bacterium]MCB9862880.1 hypothetical protein [Phycisphaerales bacterium]